MPKLDHAKIIIKSQSMVEVINKYRSFEVGSRQFEVRSFKVRSFKVRFFKVRSKKRKLFFNLLVLQHFE